MADFENKCKAQEDQVEIEKDVTKFDSARLLNVFDSPGFSDVNCHTSLNMLLNGRSRVVLAYVS